MHFTAHSSYNGQPLIRLGVSWSQRDLKSLDSPHLQHSTELSDFVWGFLEFPCLFSPDVQAKINNGEGHEETPCPTTTHLAVSFLPALPGNSSLSPPAPRERGEDREIKRDRDRDCHCILQSESHTHTHTHLDIFNYTAFLYSLYRPVIKVVPNLWVWWVVCKVCV